MCGWRTQRAPSHPAKYTLQPDKNGKHVKSAPLVRLKGKLGLYGKAGIAVDTFAAVTKSHGAYMVRAPITTSDARKIIHLEEMKKPGTT